MRRAIIILLGVVALLSAQGTEVITARRRASAVVYSKQATITFTVQPASDLSGFDNYLHFTDGNLADIGHSGYVNNTVTRYTFVISSASATVGAVYSNNGAKFTVQATIASKLSLSTYGTGAPGASGTLTLVSGTGTSSITFSSVVTGNVMPADLVFSSDSARTAMLSWDIFGWNNTTGEIWLFVKADRHAAPAANDVIYASVGSASVTAYQCTPSATYTGGGYVDVMHLEDVAVLADYSGHDNSGTNTGLTNTTGQLDGGVADNATSGNKIAITKTLVSMTGSGATYSVSFWAKFAGTSSFYTVWDGDTSSYANLDFYTRNNSNHVSWDSGLSERTYTITYTETNWNHFVLVKTATGDNGVLYLNGAAQVTYTGTLADAGNSGGSILGALQSSTNRLSGAVDEFRVSSSVLGADWIAHEYYQQAPTGTYYTVGSWN
jgi:Concanavalin A-like lectin/glucanases superfamily